MARAICICAAVALAAATVPASAAGCLKASEAMIAGQAAKPAHFVPAPCGGATVATFRYDHATGSIRLTRAVAEGDIVPAFPDYAADGVAPGDAVVVVFRDGAVAIERQVRALQAAHAGQRLFVRDDTGQVFSVSYESVVR